MFFFEEFLQIYLNFKQFNFKKWRCYSDEFQLSILSWKPSGLTTTSCQLLYKIVWYQRCLLFSLEFWQKRLIVALTWISIKNHSCLCYKTARVPNSVVVVDVLVLLLLILQTMVNPLIPGLSLWVDKDKWLVVINY